MPTLLPRRLRRRLFRRRSRSGGRDSDDHRSRRRLGGQLGDLLGQGGELQLLRRSIMANRRQVVSEPSALLIRERDENGGRRRGSVCTWILLDDLQEGGTG